VERISGSLREGRSPSGAGERRNKPPSPLREVEGGRKDAARLAKMRID